MTGGTHVQRREFTP